MSGPQAAGAQLASVELVVRLRLRHAAPIDLERLPDVLGAASLPWLGEEILDARPGQRSFLCDLELRAGGSGPTLFRKAAVLSLAEPTRRAGGWAVPVEWRAASLSALFPVFAGRLLLDREGVELDGRYAPPGGRLGYLLDVTLLGIAARQTGQWLLRLLAKAVA